MSKNIKDFNSDNFYQNLKKILFEEKKRKIIKT